MDARPRDPLLIDRQLLTRDALSVDTASARQPTATPRTTAEIDSMIDEQIRPQSRRPPSVEDAAADIRRLTAALAARREAAPDNAVELAALAVDLRRASALWRRLVPAALEADRLRGSFPTPGDAAGAQAPSAAADKTSQAPAAQWTCRNRESFK